MNFAHMKVANRLAIAFGAVLFISIIAAVLSITKLKDIEENLRDIVLDNNAKLELNHDMMDAIHVVRRVSRSVVLVESRAEKEGELAKIQKARADYDKAWEALQKFPASEKGREIRAKIQAARDAARPLNDKGIELAMTGQTAEAAKALMGEANAATAKWQEALEENIMFQQANNKSQFEHSEGDYTDARLLLIIANGLNVLVAVVLGVLVTRSITRQLGGEPADAAALAQRVAEGDLSTAIEVREGDTTSLMAQLRKMQQSLTQVVARVRQGSESVSNASAEIAQGNNDLSGRTEEQASSLEETAASMEELSATVKQNADSSRQANQLALSASSVAVKGGEVVGQVVETMKGINDSSRKIADIISVIDGIAFQTNILALNAAVEAARAGEQGRGFAVVASEVRSLAGRSAEAAKEIKALISASVERVEYGSGLVDQAGETMNEVVTSIQRVADLMGEISAASNEQASGVSQVGEAVVQMDQVTQQNAALVEEMAAAASSLRSQAQDLVQVVSVFKLDAQATPPAAPPVRHQPHSLSAPPRPAAKLAPAKPRALASAPKPAAKPAAAPSAPAKAAPAAKAADEDWETF